MKIKTTYRVQRGSATPRAAFVNYVRIIKITQQSRQLGVPLAAREPAHNNGCGPLA